MKTLLNKIPRCILSIVIAVLAVAVLLCLYQISTLTPVELSGTYATERYDSGDGNIYDATFYNGTYSISRNGTVISQGTYREQPYLADVRNVYLLEDEIMGMTHMIELNGFGFYFFDPAANYPVRIVKVQ